MISWLAGWLVDWLVGWVTGWLIGLLVGKQYYALWISKKLREDESLPRIDPINILQTDVGTWIKRSKNLSLHSSLTLQGCLRSVGPWQRYFTE